MRILVTGGFGFIGSNLVRHLLGSDHSGSGLEIDFLVNLDKMTYAANPANLSDIADDPRHFAVEGDINDLPLVSGLLERHDIDAVFHLAAESHVDRSIDSPGDFVMTNVVGTQRLLDAASLHHQLRKTEGKSFRFIHVSTDEVYGALGPDDPAFTESSPYAPNSPYSASKAASDHFARAYHRTFGLPVVITNCSNVYGPRQFPEKLVPLMISKIRQGDTLPLYGDGLQIRDWLYVEDHCRALTRILLAGRPGEVYHIGGSAELTNLEVVRRLVDLVSDHLPDSGKRDPNPLIQFVADRPGHDRRYAINSCKIREELGWIPKETPESGFPKTVDWYFENEEWLEQVLSGAYKGERLGLRG